MTTVIAVSTEIREKIRHFKTRINEAEAAVLANPDEENLTRLTDILEESRTWRVSIRREASPA
jgi:predicted component of type VI protein secretion system